MLTGCFLIGNIAIGNLHAFLPVIVKQISSSDEHRLLSLHALKEVRIFILVFDLLAD